MQTITIHSSRRAELDALLPTNPAFGDKVRVTYPAASMIFFLVYMGQHHDWLRWDMLSEWDRMQLPA